VLRAPLAAVLLAAVLAGCGGAGGATSAGSGSGGAQADAGGPVAAVRGTTDVLTGSAATLEGDRVDLRRQRGRATLVFNSASECGYTGQLGGLQRLYERFRARGLRVIGVPSDDFRQEPRKGAELAEFCRRNYGVSFTMLGVGRVTGDDATVPFRGITRDAAAPDWNFTKYLVGPDGRVRWRFATQVEPDDPALVRRIEVLLR
jgi:glutathione peroxidase